MSNRKGTPLTTTIVLLVCLMLSAFGYLFFAARSRHDDGSPRKQVHVINSEEQPDSNGDAGDSGSETVEPAAGSSEKSTRTFTYGLISIDVPSDSQITDAFDSAKSIALESGAQIMIFEMILTREVACDDSIIENLAEASPQFESNMGGAETLGEGVSRRINSAETYRVEVQGEVFRGFPGLLRLSPKIMEVVICGQQAYLVLFLVPNSDVSASAGEVQAILDSIDVGYYASGEDAPWGSMTESQQEAIETARKLLSEHPVFSLHPYLSYSTLVKKLEREGYSHDDAVYAAANCGADWVDLARGCARNYLSYDSFSRQGLLEQLMWEGFTYEQAVQGIELCDVDWNVQARGMAYDYADGGFVSRGELEEYLLSEGFTSEEAEYGASTVGY